MALVKMKPPVGAQTGLGSDKKIYTVDAQGFAYVDSSAVSGFTASGWVSVSDLPAGDPDNTVRFTKALTGGIGIMLDGVFTPLTAPIQIPRGFRLSSIALDLRRLGNKIVTDFDIRSLIPTPTKTYYVDPINGNDANAGTSAGAGNALQKLSTALAKADVDQIIISGLTADYIALGAFGWNNTTNQARSISIINRTGYRFISTMCAAFPTWTVNGTYATVYQVTAAAPVNVTDLKTKITPSYVDAQGVTRSLTNVPAKFRTLVKVASIAAVAALPGSWYHDGTVLYVQAHDARNLIGDLFMAPTSNTNNGRFTATANNLTIYAEGIDFVGGGRAFLVSMVNTITGCVFAHNNCSFQGGGVFAGGLAIDAYVTVYGYRSAAYENYLDGFNYHSNGAPATNDSTSPTAYEIECVAQGNGTTGDAGASNNASTSHEACNVIRINGTYIDSDDRPIAEINYAQSWNLGCYFGQAIKAGTSQENIVVANSAQMWLDSCYAAPGVNPRWVAAQTATLKHFNSGAVVNNSTAESTGTVAQYYG